MSTISNLKIQAIVLFLLMMVLGALRSFAQNVDFPVTYISDIAVDSKSLATHKIHYFDDNGYSEKGLDVDLNDGVTGSDYVYLGYKTTQNPLEAITDIIVVYCEHGEYSGELNKTIRYNGRTYRAAAYGKGSKGGNLNRGKSGAPDLYFYYTKDRIAEGISEGETLITGLGIYNTNSSSSNEYYAHMWYSETNVQPNADLNKGAGGHWIYLTLQKHTHKIDHQDKTTGLDMCGCGLVLDSSNSKPNKSEIDGYYTINNFSQLLWFCDYVNNDTDGEGHKACARLNCNIDMNDALHAYGVNKFKPIGSGDMYGELIGNTQWTGVFDGCGHTISNLTIEGNLPVAGFIGYGFNCTIKDLHLAGANIKSGAENSNVAGILACGRGGVHISNCSVSGELGSGRTVSGIANITNRSDFIVSSCVNRASVKGKYASGILGMSGNSTSGEEFAEINKCVNYGSICSTSNIAAAIADCNKGIVNNCLNTGAITASEAGQEVEGRIECFCSNSKIKMQHNLNLYNCDFAPDFVNDGTNYHEGNGEMRTLSSSQLKSGEACYLLNANESDAESVAWFQTIGKEDYPAPKMTGDIVYSFTNCQGKHYTNYGMYAEDMSELLHEWDYTTKPEFIGESSIGISKKCRNCGQDELCYADLQSSSILIRPTCVDYGMELCTYILSGTNQSVDFYHKTPKIQGNSSESYILKQEDGVYVCEYCGRITSFVDTGLSMEDDTYMIRNIGDLLKFKEFIYDLYQSPHNQDKIRVKLEADIDMSKYPYRWYPIYSEKNEGTINNMEFDGCGHTIRGLFMNNNATDAGFFKYINNSTIKNLTLEGYFSIKNGGMLCNTAKNSHIIDCTIKGTVYGTAGAAGLCYKSNNTEITGCRNYASVHSQSAAGGFIAYGSVSINKISKCANYGDIHGVTYAGGIVACNSNLFYMENCANYGKVEGYGKVGGIIGSVESESANNSYSDIRYCINVGKVRILDESNLKGAVAGYVIIPEANLFEQSNIYYMNTQVPVGDIDNGHVAANRVNKATAEEFASGQICVELNKAIENDGHKSKSGDDKPIWGQLIGTDPYPVLFSDNIMYEVSANDTKFYVFENQTISELTLLDGYYFNSPTTFYVKNIKYDRHNIKVKKDFYATLYLPFSFSDPRLKVMEFDHYDEVSGNVYLTHVPDDMIQSDTPYLVRMADDCTEDEIPLIITAENAKIEKSVDMFPRFIDEISDMDTGFYGTYSTKGVSGDDNFYCISTKYGDFRKANTKSAEGTVVNPFRSVFKLNKSYSAAPAKVNISAKNTSTETDINAMNFVEIDNAPIYNLNGQKVGSSVENLKSGIYIQNGKKILIK